jgi:threonine dehydrogenase-like Zn-dependent dehydrogenase
MANPWLSIPLQDYEGHMGRDNAQQLSVLSELFKRALDICTPDSVAVLGIAGGNGLEHLDHATIRRVVGFDSNARYLDEVRRRFGTYPNLELHCVDLSEGELRIQPVALVHAALFFEHTGLGGALDNALSLVAPEGRLSVVLQCLTTSNRT